jgi:VRR-NUC domain
MKYQTGMQIIKAKTTAALTELIQTDGKAEYVLHCQVVELLNKSGVTDLMYWHTPNGSKRHIVEAVKLKAMGTRKGVSDLIIAMPNGEMAYLELKGPKGRLSPEQKDFLERMHSMGHWTHVSTNFDDAYAWLVQIGAIRIGSKK